MNNLFDTIANIAVRTTDTVFGYSITWTPATGSPITGVGKYHDMPGQAKLGEQKTGMDNWKIEVTDSDFPGLKTFINGNGKANITVCVRGQVMAFTGIEARPLSDGMCTEITLRLKPV